MKKIIIATASLILLSGCGDSAPSLIIVDSKSYRQGRGLAYEATLNWHYGKSSGVLYVNPEQYAKYNAGDTLLVIHHINVVDISRLNEKKPDLYLPEPDK